MAGWIFSGKYLKNTFAWPIIGPIPPIWNISHWMTRERPLTSVGINRPVFSAR